MAKIIDGKRIAAETRARIRKDTEHFIARTGITPGLAVIIVGDNPASQVYVRNKKRACEEAGADGITLINTLLGMVIDPKSGRPIVSTKMSGFSGPAIKPVALRMVYQVASAVKIPIIGVGGISCADDVIEFMSAGASAVQVGAHNLVEPFACPNIINELPVKMDEYGIENIKDIIGRSLAL